MNLGKDDREKNIQNELSVFNPLENKFANILKERIDDAGDTGPLLTSQMVAELTPPGPRVENSNQKQNLSQDVKLKPPAVFEKSDINRSDNGHREVKDIQPLTEITDEGPTRQKLVYDVHPEEKLEGNI